MNGIFWKQVALTVLIWLCGATTRKVRINWHFLEQLQEEGQPFLLGMWHNNILTAAYDLSRRGLRYSPLISRSRDGDYINWVLSRFGFRTIRGSVSTGATGALREALRHLAAGSPVILTPDGPRGPRYRLQSGIVGLARKKGLPIVPICWSAPRRWEFSSWDRMRLSRPFSKVIVMVGTPLMIDPEADEEAERLRVERAMRDLTRVAETFSGAAERHPDPELG